MTAASDPRLTLLLDGVPYDHIAHLHARGRFRRFHPPARLISVFPTLTDPAYDVLFGTGPTPGYEAGYFDRQANRLTPALADYLRGANEHWVQRCDYRLSFVEDGLMYLFPQAVFHRELRHARRVVTERLACGSRHVAIYILSTDGLGHMLRRPQIDHELVHLDRWIDRLVHDCGGRLQITMLADHGISARPPQAGRVRPFRLGRVLRPAGVRVGRRLERPGDAIVPLFGLLDVARIHTFDAATQAQVVAALRDRPEIELLAARAVDALHVYAGPDEAIIHRRHDATRGDLCRYQLLTGDPLRYRERCAALRAVGALDPDGFADRRTWLTATWNHDFPAAPHRLWDGLSTLTTERPDVVVSLGPQWFVGSGLLSSLVRMRGTHGGLHRRVTETFIMATDADLPSPMEIGDVAATLKGVVGSGPKVR